MAATSRGPRIGLCGPAASASLQHLARALADQGAEPIYLELQRFPLELRLTVTEQGGLTGSLPLTELDAIYLAAPELMSPVPAWIPEATEWPGLRTTIHDALRAQQDARSVRGSCLGLLAAARPVINSPALHRLCSLGPQLQRRWEAAGFQVAPCVAGNDLELLARFVDRAGECRLSRPWQPAAMAGGADREAPVDLGWLKEHHRDLDRHPVVIRQVCGVRRQVLVVGEQGLAVARVEQDDPATVGAGAALALIELAVRAAREVGAAVALVELELAPDGTAWLVGLDPAPELALLDGLTAGRSSGLVAELLRAGGRADRFAAPAPRPPRPRSLPAPLATPPRIGLAGRIGDLELRTLAAALAARGAEPVPLELPLFPDRRAIHEARDRVRAGGVELDTLGAIFLRTTGFRSVLPAEEEPPLPAARWAELWPEHVRTNRDQQDCFSFKYALLELLDPRVPIINPPRAQEIHRIKVWQLATLQAAGLRVPPTLASNDPAACRAFIEAQGGPARVVLKPLAGIYKTCLLATVGLGELDRRLAEGPVILQRYIPGETRRTYLVDGQLVGAGRILHSGRTVDSSVEQEGAEPVELPDEAVAEARRAMEVLGLHWTGMDFMYEPATGLHYILECNASAMFATFSRLTGHDVPGALAELLLRRAQRA